jgi:hypothetical protein
MPRNNLVAPPASLEYHTFRLQDLHRTQQIDQNVKIVQILISHKMELLDSQAI